MVTFRAMNTDVAIAAPSLDDGAEQQLAHRIAALFAETEQRFSRFRADSEVSRLNRATGPVYVSPELLALLVAARGHVAETGGVFDPTIGRALVEAGYDRSFAPGLLDRDRAPAVAPAVRFSDLEIDEQLGRVYRPPPVLVDLGGFLKGRTVDRAAALAPAPAVVDAGGDAVLRGAGPDDEGWLVDVEDPADEQRVVTTLRVADRAVATSAPNRRRWRTGAATAHHLIDPRTARPARSDLAQVTVVAARAEDADVLAKAAFVLGADAGARLLETRPGVGAVFVARDGSTRFFGELEVVRA